MKSGHLEAELMALVAEVFRFAVHVVAVRAVELILIVRRDVGIDGLDALRLFNEILSVVALGAGLDVGRGRIGLVGAVAGRTLNRRRVRARAPFPRRRLRRHS